LSTRFSQFQGKFKLAAASKAAAHFKLRANSQGSEQATKLLQQKRYIFPGNIDVSAIILNLSIMSTHHT
jgi:hypothetical protein